MQATPSNKASNFLVSDSTGSRNAGLSIGSNGPGSNIATSNGPVRDLPSPISSPIQAARKYLERQRGTSTVGGGSHLTSGPVAGDAATQEDLPAVKIFGWEQNSWEQDRRLERSLYEGHSIEAGLNFDGAYGAADSDPAYDLAYLADSDGSEPLISYAPYAAPFAQPAPLFEPDPEAVRGAIERLARESGTVRESAVRGASYTSSANSAVLRQPAPFESSAAPSAFAEVARRVWERERLESGEWTGALASDAAAPRIDDAPVGDVCLASAAQETGEKSHASVHQLASHTGESLGGDALEQAALAHDACNLLSALGLYGDLLNSPGVLDGRHLHYADELKLIAGRSQSLIGRLLGLRGGAAETRSEMPTQEASAGRKAQVTQPTGIHLTGRRESTDNVSASETDAEMKKQAAVTAVPAASCSKEQTDGLHSTSLVDLLMRWGSLLSTLAHGTLDIAFGSQAATPVPAAAEPLERILVNLVKNARAATVNGGAIRIGVDTREELCKETAEHAAGSADTPEALSERAPASGRLLVLTVDDSGCGMTEAQVSRILGASSQSSTESVSDGYGRWLDERAAVAPAQTQRFGPISEPNLNSSNRRQGLGLQVVRELVAASGGRLAIQSRPGRGTRIEISWPVAEPAAARREVVEAAQPDVAIHLSVNARKEAAAQPALALEPIANETISSERTSNERRIAEFRAADSPAAQAAIGPDGFSEQELRAMMLRLHRAGPPGNRPAPNRFGAGRAEEEHGEKDKFSAVKGAIAC